MPKEFAGEQERRTEILKAEEAIRGLAKEMASALESSRLAEKAIQALDRASKALTDATARVSETVASAQWAIEGTVQAATRALTAAKDQVEKAGRDLTSAADRLNMMAQTIESQVTRLNDLVKAEGARSSLLLKWVIALLIVCLIGISSILSFSIFAPRG